jgi:predicted Zn-ribbon and HTH transcriptional regulator
MINLNMKKTNIIMKNMTNITKNNTMNNNKCRFCGYEWGSRVSEPKSCPLCKRYLIEKPGEE